MQTSVLVALALAIGLAAPAVIAQDLTAADRAMPRYDHVFVIVEENKNYEQILDPAAAPNIAGLAARYGDAAQFFSEVHPSEANYVAMLGGDTFGIHDDDAFYCRAGSTDRFCAGAAAVMARRCATCRSSASRSIRIMSGATTRSARATRSRCSRR
jgi:hypothetical protein